MKEKKDQDKVDNEQEDSFTGSPEQQLPDLEAEEKKSDRKDHSNNKNNSDDQNEN